MTDRQTGRGQRDTRNGTESHIAAQHIAEQLFNLTLRHNPTAGPLTELAVQYGYAKLDEDGQLQTTFLGRMMLMQVAQARLSQLEDFIGHPLINTVDKVIGYIERHLSHFLTDEAARAAITAHAPDMMQRLQPVPDSDRPIYIATMTEAFFSDDTDPLPTSDPAHFLRHWYANLAMIEPEAIRRAAAELATHPYTKPYNPLAQE